MMSRKRRRATDRIFRLALERVGDPEFRTAVERHQRKVAEAFMLPANAVRERSENEKLGRPADANLDAVQGSADVPPEKY